MKSFLMALYSSNKCSAHQNYVIQNDQKPMASIQSFHFTREEQHIQAILKLYSAKTEYSTTFWCPLELYSTITPRESIQSKFLMAIFKVVPCVPNIVLRERQD